MTDSTVGPATQCSSSGGLRCAAVYRFKEKLIIQPQHEALGGLRVSGGPVFETGAASAALAGQLVVAALRAAMTGVPFPGDPRLALAPVLQAAGVSTLRSFMKSAHLVLVEELHGNCAIIPNVNRGSYFEPVVQERRGVSIDDLAEIGKAIEWAFTRVA